MQWNRREFAADHAFYQGDIADGGLIDRIFAEHPDIAAVIHCAVTHGPFATIGGGSAHPAITYGAVIATVG